MEQTLIQKIQEFLETEVTLGFMEQKTVDRLNYYLDTFFVKEEKKQIKDAYLRGIKNYDPTFKDK